MPKKKKSSDKHPIDQRTEDPCPGLVVERGPEDIGVGSWVPAQKHRLLYDYLYWSRHAWKKWPSRVFIDPFAGPGRIQVAGESFTRDGGALVAYRALSETAPFTNVLVGDLELDRLQACSQRLRAVGAAVIAYPGPAVETIKQMVAAAPTNALCMAYIDPYNLELLDFSIIHELAKLRKVDLAINFSTMDLQRNADIELKRGRFDDAVPGCRTQPAIARASKQNIAIEMFRYWCGLVRQLGFEHSQEMPLVCNDQGAPIYRMVFFARHKLPNRIWGDVARGPNRELFAD